MRMGKAGDDVDLAKEPFGADRSRELGFQDLESNLAVELWSCARYTSAIAPEPSTRSISYRPAKRAPTFSTGKPNSRSYAWSATIRYACWRRQSKTA
jgi:hypothetical protein